MSLAQLSTVKKILRYAHTYLFGSYFLGGLINYFELNQGFG